jgi:hypothetical protein
VIKMMIFYDTGDDGVETVMTIYGYCLCDGFDHIDDKKNQSNI